MLLRDYLNPSNLYKNCELPRNQIGRHVIRVKKENEKFTAVVCSRSPQILEFGHFTLLFCTGRHRNVPKFKTHVQGDCFSSLNLFFLRRCCCCRRRRCLSYVVSFRGAFKSTALVSKNSTCGCMATLFIGLPMVFAFTSPKFKTFKT